MKNDDSKKSNLRKVIDIVKGVDRKHISLSNSRNNSKERNKDSFMIENSNYNSNKNKSKLFY